MVSVIEYEWDKEERMELSVVGNEKNGLETVKGKHGEMES